MPRHFRFKVTLKDLRPPIWRRFLLTTTASFADLHQAIQDSCGWDDCHLHTFLQASGRRAELPGARTREGEADWAATPLDSWFKERGKGLRKCLYWYDFGDDWMHEVELEELEEHPEEDGRKLLAGKRAFPPEDCGGIPGYQRSIRVLKRARTMSGGAQGLSQEETELLEWLGDWDPERFDLHAARARFDLPILPRPWARESESVRPELDEPGRVVMRSIPGAPTTRPANLGLHVHRIILAATTHQPDETVTTGLACLRRPNRRPCPGRITVTRRSSGEVIEWRCSDCSDGGILSNWSGGPADMKQEADAYTRHGGDPLSLRIPSDVYGALVDANNLVIKPTRLLCSARASAGQVVLRGDVEELGALHEALGTEASLAPVGAHFDRLESAFFALERTLEKDLVAAVEEADLADPIDELELELEDDGEDEAVRAVVAEAVKGLPLTGEEIDGLGSMYRELRHLLSALGSEAEDRIAVQLRESAETLVLHRKIREALAIRSIEYRQLSLFLDLLDCVLDRVVEFGRRCPSGGLTLCAQFLKGVGDIADQVCTDENELADFNAFVARDALEMAGRIDQPHLGSRPLLEQLLDLWLADECFAFHFVPDLIVDLKLGKRERNWLRKRIDERLGRPEAGDTDGLEELKDRLR